VEGGPPSFGAWAACTGGESSIRLTFSSSAYRPRESARTLFLRLETIRALSGLNMMVGLIPGYISNMSQV